MLYNNNNKKVRKTLEILKKITFVTQINLSKDPLLSRILFSVEI